MKRLLAAAAALLVSVSAAAAAHATEITVSVGPELQKHARAYGERELVRLQDDLRRSVASALARSDEADPQRIDLVLESATPNRPTFQQLGVSGLSMFSIGIGGAAISGSVTAADGTVQPLSYRWREANIQNVQGYTTWTDANRAFLQLASQLAKGRVPNAGPYRPDLVTRPAFNTGRTTYSY